MTRRHHGRAYKWPLSAEDMGEMIANAIRGRQAATAEWTLDAQLALVRGQLADAVDDPRTDYLIKHAQHVAGMLTEHVPGADHQLGHAALLLASILQSMTLQGLDADEMISIVAVTGERLIAQAEQAQQAGEPAASDTPERPQPAERWKLGRAVCLHSVDDTGEHHRGAVEPPELAELFVETMNRQSGPGTGGDVDLRARLQYVLRDTFIVDDVHRDRLVDALAYEARQQIASELDRLADKGTDAVTGREVVPGLRAAAVYVRTRQ